MDIEFISKSENETKQFAFEFAKNLKQGDIVLLNGDLGAGKTVFVKGIVDYYSDGKSIAVSPTFLIVNEYETKPRIYHFDLYRINDVSELDAIGAEELFFGDGICFVEWPERADGMFPDYAISVEIKKINDNERLIRIKK